MMSLGQVLANTEYEYENFIAFCTDTYIKTTCNKVTTPAACLAPSHLYQNLTY